MADESPFRAALGRSGHLLLDDLVALRELATLRAICDRLAGEEDALDGKYHDIERGADRRFLRYRHVDHTELASLITSPALVDLAAELLGAPPYLFNEHFVVKGPAPGPTSPGTRTARMSGSGTART